jgi:heat shock protein HslJ
MQRIGKVFATAPMRGAVLALLAATLPGCQPNPPERGKSASTATASAPVAIDPSAPSLKELEHAAYAGVEEADGPFTLANGQWDGKPYQPDGASHPSVTMVRNLRLVGDLDGDGRDDAVVLLAAGTGGTGETLYLAVAQRERAGLRNTATAPLGDRVQVRAARLDGRRVVLDLVQGGNEDAGCCPGDLVTRTWELQAGRLVEGTATRTGRLSLATLGGAEWVLRAWAWDEPAPASPVVTLKLEGTRLVGFAGCNSYFAPAKTGRQPGDLKVGTVGSTRKACPPPEMAAETRFLQQLAGVSRMRFAADQLALSYAGKDNSSGVMLFERRQP